MNDEPTSHILFLPLIVLSFISLLPPRESKYNICVSVGLSLFFHVLIYRPISLVSPHVSLYHHEELNQTTTLPKALLTCFNS